jgi:hypothetical protein
VDNVALSQAFITATRQLAAQQCDVSIEQLTLHMAESRGAAVVVGGEEDSAESSTADQSEGAPLESGEFWVGGLWMEGGVWSTSNNSIEASDVLRSDLGRSKLAWRPQAASEVSSCVTLPVYDGLARSQLLFSVQTRSAPQVCVARCPAFYLFLQSLLICVFVVAHSRYTCACVGWSRCLVAMCVNLSNPQMYLFRFVVFAVVGRLLA